MKCPRCSGALHPSTLREMNMVYNAHTCASCQGLWIGPEQLKDIELTVDQEFLELRKIPKTKDQQVILNCPQCAGAPAMNKVASPRDKNVIMDICATCQHVWLDHGEREAIEKQGFGDLMTSFFRG